MLKQGPWRLASDLQAQIVETEQTLTARVEASWPMTTEDGEIMEALRTR